MIDMFFYTKMRVIPFFELQSFLDILKSNFISDNLHFKVSFPNSADVQSDC